MSDSFFGFETDMPTLGSGQLEGENELIEAPEEEEAFDLLNDETFGNATDDVDWEEQHERLAGDHDARLKLESLQDGLDPMRSQEEFMEQSISQLVVEDEEESSPEPETSHNQQMRGPASQARAIPVKNNLDELFGPSSPPGILSAEQLVSPGPNIWGSPVRESLSAPQGGSLKALLHQLQHPPPQMPGVPSQAGSGSMPNAKTLEELEREMMAGPSRMGTRSAAVSIPGALRHPPPRVMTAEQLERELTGQPPPVIPQLPIGTPPPGFSHPHHHAAVLPRHMMNGAHGDREHARGSPPSFPPPHTETPPFPNAMPRRVSPPGSMKTHTVAPPSVAARMSPVIPQQGRSPYSSAVAAGVIGPTVQKPPVSTAANGVDRSSPPNALTAFLANTPVRQRVSLPMPFSDPTHLRSGRGHHHGHHAGQQEAPHARQALFHSHHRPHPQNPRQNYMGHAQRRHFHGNSYYDPAGGGDHMYRDVDEYAGLMTQREKDWIIKIQLMQLHTDNPYVDDFYYTTWMLGQMASERKKKLEAAQGDDKKEREKGEPKLLIPSLAKAENKNYRPVQFEGSLGRLTASSVHNPRQILDVKSADMKTHEESQKVREIRRFKQLLLRIEQGYDVLLDIDEMEKMALALPENERQAVFETRKEKISGLVECLQVAEGEDAGFLQVMSVRKGKKLLGRVLPLTTQAESSSIIQAFIRNLASWNKKEQQEEVCETCLEPICESLQTSDAAHLVPYCQLLLSQPQNASSSLLQTAVSSKVGMSVVLCMLNRVEQLHRQSDQPFPSTQQHNSWCTFVGELVKRLQDANCDGLSQIQGAFPLVSKHLCRMVDQPQLVSAQGVFKTLICTEQ